MKTTIWIATAQYHGETIYLPDYIGTTKSEAGWKVIEKARREGFSGDVDTRLKDLGWEIVEVELNPVNKSQNTTKGENNE